MPSGEVWEASILVKSGELVELPNGGYALPGLQQQHQEAPQAQPQDTSQQPQEAQPQAQPEAPLDAATFAPDTAAALSSMAEMVGQTALIDAVDAYARGEDLPDRLFDKLGQHVGDQETAIRAIDAAKAAYQDQAWGRGAFDQSLGEGLAELATEWAQPAGTVQGAPRRDPRTGHARRPLRLPQARLGVPRNPAGGDRPVGDLARGLQRPPW